MMTTFKQYLQEQQTLLEDRISFIKQSFKDISTDHDTFGKHKTADAIVDHFAKHADPSPNKIHTQWIMKQYRKGNIRQEDHPRIKNTLTNFTAHKNKLENKDLNSYPSLAHVDRAVQPHLGTATSNRATKKIVKHEGADLVHDSDGVTVHHIKTEDASKLYGKGTHWCTAGDNHNMFNYYNDKGKIHVIQHQGRKYQFFVNANQFMNERDKKVGFKDMHPSIGKSLAKSKNPDILHLNMKFRNPHNSKTTIDRALNHTDHYVRELATRHPKATSKHLSKALTDTSSDVRSTAASHRNATHEHLDTAMKDTNPIVRSRAVINPNATPKHLDMALKDSTPGVRMGVVHNSNATPKHLDAVLKDPKLMSIKTEMIRAVSAHPNATPKHLDMALTHGDMHTKIAAINHPNATHEHLSKALQDSDEFVRSAAAGHRNATHEHLSKALQDPSEYVQHIAKQHPRNPHKET